MTSDTRYTITILNWEKYQREMRGGEKRRRRRDWVAISVDLFSDPDYLAMTSLYRNLWLALLLHAGKVGPVFKLCQSSARVMFQLRRTCDFQVLVDQGFIDLEAATDKTDKTDKTVKVAPLPKINPKRKPPKKKKPKKPASEIDGLNLDAWGKWLSYRTATSKPVYTTNGIAIKLAKLPHDAQMSCVDASIDQGYTGLFPGKFTGAGSAQDNNGVDNSFGAKRARLAATAGLDPT